MKNNEYTPIFSVVLPSVDHLLDCTGQLVSSHSLLCGGLSRTLSRKVLRSILKLTIFLAHFLFTTHYPKAQKGPKAQKLASWILLAV